MPPGLGIIRSRKGSGRNLRSLSVGPQRRRGSPRPRHASMETAVRRPPRLIVRPCCCAPDPTPPQKRGIGHQVEQVVEPAAGIGARPTVQLGLHLPYPSFGPSRTGSGIVGIHRRVSWHCIFLLCRTCCPPSPCGGLSRPRTTTGAPPRPRPSVDGGPSPTIRTGCPAARATGGRFPRSLLIVDQGGARLYPRGIATATPQTFTVASRTDRRQPARELPTHEGGRRAPLPAQIHQVRAGGTL